LKAILNREATFTESEDSIGDKTYKTRMVADLDQTAEAEEDGKLPLNGVLGVVVDVTDMKARAKLELANAHLTAQQQAATDSNRMKSQFLANVCLSICQKLA
jgi:hypothetical protein